MELDIIAHPGKIQDSYTHARHVEDAGFDPPDRRLVRHAALLSP